MQTYLESTSDTWMNAGEEAPFQFAMSKLHYVNAATYRRNGRHRIKDLDVRKPFDELFLPGEVVYIQLNAEKTFFLELHILTDAERQLLASSVKADEAAKVLLAEIEEEQRKLSSTEKKGKRKKKGKQKNAANHLVSGSLAEAAEQSEQPADQSIIKSKSKGKDKSKAKASLRGKSHVPANNNNSSDCSFAKGDSPTSNQLMAASSMKPTAAVNQQTLQPTQPPPSNSSAAADPVREAMAESQAQKALDNEQQLRLPDRQAFASQDRVLAASPKEQAMKAQFSAARAECNKVKSELTVALKQVCILETELAAERAKSGDAMASVTKQLADLQAANAAAKNSQQVSASLVLCGFR